ncbi:F0F1 ATP synthase subunit A [Escherichia coli]|nr:F0F1 ATP synthase subunit A [Escherichia coli]
MIIFFLTKKINSFLTHLVPEGAPALLTPALVLIELTRNLIRPITLSVRLIANITAGHLLIHLLRSLVCYIYPISPLLIPVSIILTSLELIVAFIQAYIFCALLSLYSREIH